MRNPFRRQATTATPTLRERATALREGLSCRVAASAPVERADLLDRLLTLYAEDRAARPISGREDDTVAGRAASLVSSRLWALAREIVALPPPATLDGLRVTVLASAILCEAEAHSDDPATLVALGLTRATLAITGTPLPPGFVGFGYEPDHDERDDALYAAPGSVPAWAIAEIEAKEAADLSARLAGSISKAHASAPLLTSGPIADRDLPREAFAYAYSLDLSAVPLDCLLRMSDVLHRQYEALSDVVQEDWFYTDLSLRIQNHGGEIMEAESNRLSCLRDVCIAEMAQRVPENEADRDAILVARVHHEMLCETRIRDHALLAEIREAWGGE